MRRLFDAVGVATAIALSLALAGCGTTSKAGTARASTSADTKSSNANGTDLCALLTDDQVSGVLGPHTKGETGVETGAKYGDQSCVWKATAASGGYTDSLEVSVLTGGVAGIAREDAARAQPVASFGHDARFDQSYGQLWFDCGDKFCHVRVATGHSTTHSGAARKDAAIELARRILERQ